MGDMVEVTAGTLAAVIVATLVVETMVALVEDGKTVLRTGLALGAMSGNGSRRLQRCMKIPLKLKIKKASFL